jgi:hypothetical protein
MSKQRKEIEELEKELAKCEKEENKAQKIYDAANWAVSNSEYQIQKWDRQVFGETRPCSVEESLDALEAIDDPQISRPSSKTLARARTDYIKSKFESTEATAAYELAKDKTSETRAKLNQVLKEASSPTPKLEGMTTGSYQNRVLEDASSCENPREKVSKTSAIDTPSSANEDYSHVKPKT